ncbi:ABC transporter substrate-binding protein [Variovorax sp. J31P207]|uniref:heme/hemin ABC transporter substrate-binding protein n=1 Tax=Variovorax sp. J31P207 TaxID=3053510 RepID=UPI002576BC5B|nr:ABC transporter substrate-binding protein [Variovorax sp. J31P207]MDM0069233.1 ABC transporter substrate-binding protein [Variovorax sp. J31P207]
MPNRRDALRLAGAGALAACAGTALAQGPRAPRLVTISGAITEVVYALGAESQLVGTDTTSLYPEAARQTPKVGYMRQLSAEGLLSLKPDAVIATTESGPPVVLDQLRTAGVRLELVEADHSWSEVQRKVAAVGRAAARERQARELMARLDAEWAGLQQRVAASPGRKPRVLFVLSHSASPQVSGEKTAANAVIGFAGGVNCLSGFQGYRPMTAEAMASAAPDVILTTTQSIEAHGGAEKFWQRPELALTPAFKRRALVAQDALLLLGFGPRLPAAVSELHKSLRAA